MLISFWSNKIQGSLIKLQASGGLGSSSTSSSINWITALIPQEVTRSKGLFFQPYLFSSKFFIYKIFIYLVISFQKEYQKDLSFWYYLERVESFSSLYQWNLVSLLVNIVHCIYIFSLIQTKWFKVPLGIFESF